MAGLQTSYMVEAVYVEGAAEKRAPFREDHLDRMGKLYREGVVLVAGALADMSASVMVLNVDFEETARAIIETDTYWRNGIWTGFTIRKLNRVAFEQ
ncbi:MAG: YciI family protein [Actinomycetota bacterium]